MPQPALLTQRVAACRLMDYAFNFVLQVEPCAAADAAATAATTAAAAAASAFADTGAALHCGALHCAAALGAVPCLPVQLLPPDLPALQNGGLDTEEDYKYIAEEEKCSLRRWAEAVFW